jgi:hypothetical protein
MQRMQGWIGRKDRFPVAMDAVVHRADGESVTVRLTDFSEEGCRMEGDEIFQIGEHVRIDVPRMGLVKAQVRWALGGNAGTRFMIEPEA